MLLISRVSHVAYFYRVIASSASRRRYRDAQFVRRCASHIFPSKWLAGASCFLPVQTRDICTYRYTVVISTHAYKAILLAKHLYGSSLKYDTLSLSCYEEPCLQRRSSRRLFSFVSKIRGVIFLFSLSLSLSFFLSSPSVSHCVIKGSSNETVVRLWSPFS